MGTSLTFDTIITGAASAAEARTLLADAFERLDERVAYKVYGAFRAWLWKTLDGRRRDQELHEWLDLLKRTEAFIASRFSALGARFEVLCELLYESISVSRTKNVDLVLRRAHVRSILAMMLERSGLRMKRSVLGERLGLGQANLTRVLNMMMAARLIERSVDGKNAIFQLTTDGREAARNVVIEAEESRHAASEPSHRVRRAIRTRTTSDDAVERRKFAEMLHSVREKRQPGFLTLSSREFVIAATRCLNPQLPEERAGSVSVAGSNSAGRYLSNLETMAAEFGPSHDERGSHFKHARPALTKDGVAHVR